MLHLEADSFSPYFRSIVKKEGDAEHVQFYADDRQSYFFISLGLIPKYFLKILLKCSGDS